MCMNPSDTFNGKCQFCEISEYGKIPEIPTVEQGKVPEICTVDEPIIQELVKRRRRRSKDE